MTVASSAECACFPLLAAPMKMHASVESTPVESVTASAEAAKRVPADMPEGGTTMPERAGVPDMRDAREGTADVRGAGVSEGARVADVAAMNDPAPMRGAIMAVGSDMTNVSAITNVIVVMVVVIVVVIINECGSECYTHSESD